MISVVVTYCVDDASFLSRCMSSVEWQLSAGDEVLYVIDSKSERHESLKSDGRGISAARNVGWRAARNQWVKFLDVDDLLAPFALNALRVMIPETQADLIVGGQFVVHNGLLVGLRKADPTSLKQLKIANPWVVSHTAMRRSMLEKIDGFDERIHFEEDWDLWLRLHNADGKVAFSSAPLCYYTIDDQRRAETDAKRDHTVEGIDVREYFRRQYGCQPELAA